MDDLRYQVDLLAAKNQKLNNNERMYNMICETSNAAFLYINYSNNTVRTLGNWSSYFDLKVSDPSEFLRLLDYFGEKDEAELRRLFYVEKDNKTIDSGEFEMAETGKWISIEVSVHLDESNNVVERLIAVSDVTNMRNKRDELTYMAYYDMLTGLYNRNYFITKLKEFVEKADAEHAIISVLFMDIDDFHKISDARGIVTGDEVVQNLGIYLHSLMGTHIVASRFDSDNYVLAIYDPCGSRSVENVYGSIKNFLSEPMRLSDRSEASISVSVGAAEYPEASDNALQLINCAEIAMLKAKEAGKDNIKYFDNRILENFLRDVDIENRLKEAVHNSNFYMNFQPQYHAENGKLRGVEALIRWKDSDGTVISPGVFIPLAEKSGMIISIGDYVLDESIRTHMEWKKKFDYSMVLSINISSIQYNRPDFVGKVLAAIKKYDMDPEELELEITESVLIDDFKSVIQKMYELRDYGIRVSLDDFGTGFSSLSYLRGLPIDTLKIDKSFIDNIIDDDASRIITESIINMSKRLGFETVAEGVETKEQLEYLKEISCDLIQGFYLGKPMDNTDIEDLLLRIV